MTQEMKDEGVSQVLDAMRRGSGVSLACREVGAKLEMNANTLRRLISEYRRAHPQEFDGNGLPSPPR